jgi:hypothetical protein
MNESFRTYRKIGTPRDRLSLIDCLPPQAPKLFTGRIMPCRTITSVNLYVDNPSLILEYLVRGA